MISLQFLNSQWNIVFSYRVPNKRKILTYWNESSGSQDSQGGREYDVPGQAEKDGSGEENGLEKKKLGGSLLPAVTT